MDQLHIAATAESSKRMPRMRFSSEASERLMSIYQSGISKPNKQLREELAHALNKTPRSIQIWFQNRRAKAKVAALKGEYFPAGESEENENPSPLEHSPSKASLSKLNMNAVESLSSPRSAKLNHSPLKSPYSGPKSAYAFPSRHDPYPYPISPKQRLAESQSPSHPYPQQKVLETARFSPYPSPLDSHSPHPKNFQPQYMESNGQHQQPYSRFAKQDMRLEVNNLNGYQDNVPHSAFEMRSSESSYNFSDPPPSSSYLPKMPSLSIREDYKDNYNAPHSAMPYASSRYTFPDTPNAQSPQIFSAPARYAESNSSPESTGYKGNTLPDLNEIAADPAKFMQWISTSR